MSKFEGPNVMFYTDHRGRYWVDEFGHQVYHLEAGIRMRHVDCEGQLKTVDEEEAYYYDTMGRYVVRNGEKLHQVLSCCSLYREAESTLLEKVTVDCGHSTEDRKECGMKIKDPYAGEILPQTEHVDIKNSLNKETAEYLWGAMGAILPLALRDVGLARPRNPTHHLAHRLLLHKYSNTTGELKKMEANAKVFREKKLKQRSDKAKAESRAWKSKQVQRRKPEEFDDAAERATYEAYLATNQLINSLDYYN